MKNALLFVMLVIGSAVYSCKDEKAVDCSDLTGITVDLQNRDLETVQTYIEGHWKLYSIDGGFCLDCHPIPDNNHIVFDGGHLLWMQADTVVHDGDIEWKRLSNSKWTMENFGLTVDKISEGTLILNSDLVMVDGIGYSLRRNCVDATE